MKIKTINFKQTKGKPLYIQLYEKIRNDILNGYLLENDQLPSIRLCEKTLKISKTSISHAYEKLLEEGYISAIAQKGYFVQVNNEQLELRKALIEQPIKTTKTNLLYDFRSQSMDFSSFDINLWKKYLKDVLDTQAEITTYGEAQGEEVLRVALQKYAYGIRGVLCDKEQILIGASFQSLLYILCGLLKQPLTIGMEASGFPPAERVFYDYGFSIQKIKSESDGICMQALYDSNIQMLYVNSGSFGSNHQPLTKAKRDALLKWANDKNALIIEDDHNGELRYLSKSIPAMQGFDMGKHVIYIGSFSKLLLPSLRISYMVFTNDLLLQFKKHINDYNPTASKIEQLALAHYMVDNHLERHVKKLRKRYEQKSKKMQFCLQHYFSNCTILLEEAALQFIIRFPQAVNIDDFIQRAKAKQILMQKNGDGDLVLSFAAIKEEEIEEAIKALKEAIQ
ncbi:MAG: PLP-dependent aminotransferase family protein [Erysipelotrichia bacterium]|nr:PLP-dependent aminotransferase family protein [Erysipelotrichia bacterium]NCC55219.1 PLP-dependent aminotransferase family protein [Erysipelotrichia bacterium]